MIKTLNTKQIKNNVIKTIDLLTVKLKAWERIHILLQNNRTRFEGKKVTKRLITFLQKDSLLNSYNMYLDLDYNKKVRSLVVWGNGIEFDKRVVLYFGFKMFNDEVKTFNLNNFCEQNARFKHVPTDIQKLKKELNIIDQKVEQYNTKAYELDALRNNFHALRFVNTNLYI